MSKGLRVFCFQLKQELVQVRVLILFMILAVFIYSYLEPVANLAQAAHEKVSPWAFPHLMNDYICQMVFMVSAVFPFSTAPFEGKAHYYIVQRSGNSPKTSKLKRKRQAEPDFCPVSVKDRRKTE